METVRGSVTGDAGVGVGARAESTEHRGSLGYLKYFVLHYNGGYMS